MEVKRGLYIFIIFELISLGLLVTGSQPKLYRGTQQTMEEYIIPSNNNFTIACMHTENITWTCPNNSILGTSCSTFRVTDDLISDKEYKFRSSLTISNASSADVGFYYCHEINADISDASKSISIYLYVEDEDNLAVITSDNDITTEQHSEFVIPCKPTSPNVSIKLYKYSDDSEIIADYDPKLAKPYIEDLNLGHAVVGDTLKLKCTLRSLVPISMEWKIPDDTEFEPGRVIKSPVNITNESFHHKFIHIRNISKADQGNFSCFVKYCQYENNSTIFIKIYDAEEHFIHLSEENDMYNISIHAGEPFVQWLIDVNAHPWENLTIHWLNNNNRLVDDSDSKMNKYETKYSRTEAFLKINSVNINDHGNYTLLVQNKFGKKELKLSLDVTDKPSVHIEASDFHYINSNSTITCVATGNPQPKIYWKYEPCLDQSCESKNISEINLQRNGIYVVSLVRILSNTTGKLYCFAVNSLGNDSDSKPFYITDIKYGFHIWYSDNIIDEPRSMQKIVSIGDKLKLYCGASVYKYTNDINWYNNNLKIENDNDYIIERSHTEYSNKVALIIRSATKNNSGTYFCNAISINSGLNRTKIILKVLEPQLPEIYETNMQDTIAMELPDALHVKCFITGIPKPNLYWFKDNDPIYADNRTEFFNNSQILQLRKTIDTDEGTYSCKASNKVGYVQKSMSLRFINKQAHGITNEIIIFLIVVLSTCLIILFVQMLREAKLQNVLKEVGLANFKKGDVDILNPDLGIEDQAELLPYDIKWELPRENIKLGKQLGSGAFGVVVKAEVAGLLQHEKTTIAAVKMVKRNADHALIKALASELKIMAHLGKHINILNLLGACTKNIAKCELLVIVEYCRFGNLQNYLLRHRDNFIDQIDMNTGKIDFWTGSEILDRSLSFSSHRSNSHSSKSPTLKYISFNYARSADERGHVNKLMENYHTNPTVNYCTNTDTTTILMTPSEYSENLFTSNDSSTQPEWRSNYRGDYRCNVKPICTKDLLAWSFQVARAMEYLASRKVLHGDLAARNILLADDNVVKICDFGLAKSMYKSGNYIKKGDGLVPFKWMSIEAVRDSIFSTQSDVWSFGIVLWEFFSLGRTPYPGMEADESLYNKLKDGFRMDAPIYATKEIHDMMLDCWEAKPLNRPTFAQLVDNIGILLEESVKQYYVDLNEPYLIMNTNRLKPGETDYLAMCSPPDHQSLCSPQNYVNEANNEYNHPNGYLCMKPQIFTPRDADSEVFSYDSDCENAELSPMLHTHNESDPEVLDNLPKNNSAIVNNSKDNDLNITYVNSSALD